MKKVAFSLVFALSAAFASAQESQTEYNFLRLPVSAHAAALGGDNVSLIEDDEALIFNNPALLASVTDQTLNLNYMNYMQGANTASAAYNRVAGEKGAWAVSGQYMNYGTMKQTDENGTVLGDFSAKDISLAGYYSYVLGNHFVGGISAKFILSYIGEYSSTAMGVDLGINYYDEEKELSVSAVAKNLGGQLKAYDDTYEKMPIDLQVGFTKRFAHTPFRVSATFVDLNHLDYGFFQHAVVGVDLLLSNQLWVGAGYNLRRAKQMKIVAGEENESSHGAGLSLGAGVNLDRLKINVAYGKYHVSSSSIVISLGYTL